MNLSLKAWSSSAAEAPLGLRRPATTTLVSTTYRIIYNMRSYTMSKQIQERLTRSPCTAASCPSGIRSRAPALWSS